MTSEQFVKERYPDAVSERYKNTGWTKEVYYLIWDTYKLGGRRRLGEGATISKGWKDAKENIEWLDFVNGNKQL